jgi:putative Holliday junction resolvase
MIFNNKDQVNQDYKANVAKSGSLLGIDVGTKRIGIAVSDKTRFIATPKLVINRQSNLKDFAKIANLIKEYESCAIVMGYPVNMKGELTDMSRFVTEFAKNLDEFLEKKLPIFFFEERLTSFEAKGFAASELSRKKGNDFVDDIAASLILQHFLDDNYS